MHNNKDFLSIADLPMNHVNDLINIGCSSKTNPNQNILNKKNLVLLFEKPSLRTRVSFEIGIRQFGGECIYLNKEDVGMNSRENANDIAKVLDRWADGIIARVFQHSTLITLSENTSIPVINALSDQEHPCQAIADLMTIKEHKGNLKGLKVVFVGDGNNVATSLSIGCASVGADFILSCPSGYEIQHDLWLEAQKRASITGAKLEIINDPKSAVSNADVIYTDVWISMGQEDETKNRIEKFSQYQVNPELMSLSNKNAIFMHDMPAHENEEISVGMLDHPQSVVFDQAENRLHAQKGILSHIFTNVN
jgi:ornithine carbamoyltransferase|tara:strand:+ start:901 stop:1824 length:924 start_codon:yes stop_codon:yes gene_type:complete